MDALKLSTNWRIGAICEVFSINSSRNVEATKSFKFLTVVENQAWYKVEVLSLVIDILQQITLVLIIY